MLDTTLKVDGFYRPSNCFERYSKQFGRGMAANYKAIQCPSLKELEGFSMANICCEDGSNSIYFFNDLGIIRISNHWVINKDRVVLINGHDFGGRYKPCIAGEITLLEAVKDRRIAVIGDPKWDNGMSHIFQENITPEYFEELYKLALHIRGRR